MGPYAYPITIRRKPQTICWEESKEFESLSLAILQPFVGDLNFEVTEQKSGDYEVSVTRSRLETPEELSRRVAGEVAYMKEYEKRKEERDKKKADPVAQQNHNGHLI